MTQMLFSRTMNSQKISVPPTLASPHGSELLEIRSASGAKLWSTSGEVYIDLTAGWNVANLGWGNAQIVAAAEAQLHRLATAPAWAASEPLMQLTAALTDCFAYAVSILYAPTGTQAVEFALRVATRATGRARIVSVSECYHGSTCGSLRASGIEYLRREIGANPDPELLLPLPTEGADIEAQCRAIRRAMLCEPSPAAVLLEPLFLNVGAIPCPRWYMDAVISTARECGALVIIDEVSTGCGRLGSFLGHHLHSVTPDMVVLGKALGGGVAPLAAVVMRRELRYYARGLAFDATFAAIPLGCAAARVAVRLLSDEQLLAQARGRMRDAYTSVAKRLHCNEQVREIRGAGCVYAIELAAESRSAQARLADAVVDELLLRGVFAARSRYTNALLIMPPLTIPPEDLGFAMGAVCESVEAATSTSNRVG